jgi:hypothetical protein
MNLLTQEPAEELTAAIHFSHGLSEAQRLPGCEEFVRADPRGHERRSYEIFLRIQKFDKNLTMSRRCLKYNALICRNSLSTFCLVTEVPVVKNVSLSCEP